MKNFILWLYGADKHTPEPRICDRLIERYNRLQRLREIARQQSARDRSDLKLIQATRLINQVVEQLNNRPNYFNQFNLN